jgi:hypothetical protein
MTGFFEIHETFLEIIKQIVGFFSGKGGGGRGVYREGISGSFWEHVSAQSQQKGNPETSVRIDAQKNTRALSTRLPEGGRAQKTK